MAAERQVQAPVVQTLDSAIHWINHYPLDNSIGFASVYPLDSDLSGGQRYPSFEQLGPGHQEAFCNKRSHGIKSAMLEGKLIIIPALGHQNRGKSSFTGSGLFVLMSQCGNNNELALQHGGFYTM